MNKTKKWIPELQSFSGLAIIFVVLIHTTSYYLLSVLHMSSFEKVDYGTRLVDNLIHGAVPIFIFIAGYKYALNSLEVPYKKIVKNKISRVVKPFLIISTIFFVKNIISSNEHINVLYVVVTLGLTFITVDYLCGPLRRFVLWPMSVIAYYFLVVRIIENKLLQYLGKYSFYIFLLHEPIFCTDISYIFKFEGIYYSVVESFIIGIFTLIVTMLLYKIIEKSFIKKIIF